jgi:hypothetical protein
MCVSLPAYRSLLGHFFFARSTRTSRNSSGPLSRRRLRLAVSSTSDVRAGKLSMTSAARSFALSARPALDCFRGTFTVRPSSTNRQTASGKLGLSDWLSAQRTMDARIAGEAWNPINGYSPVIADFIAGTPFRVLQGAANEHGPVGKFGRGVEAVRTAGRDGTSRPAEDQSTAG